MFTYVKGYQSKLSLRDTQKAIKRVKDIFQGKLSKALNLERVTAPVIVKSGTGINDDLNGVERFVTFDLKNIECKAEVVHSLAKWKRTALKKYGFKVDEGLYTDMNAIRRDDDVDNIHSIFVDQWDWERVISKEERNVEFLKKVVCTIVTAIADTADEVRTEFSALTPVINRDVFFITSQELLDAYPDKTPKEREYEIVKKHGTVFVMQIGGALSDGKKHDGRAPDYDDWSLNGDILVWNAVLSEQLELSSMGIRVDAESLLEQLKITGDERRLEYDYHKAIVASELPLAIGGGIGQSRLCMFMLQKLHIGEVQVSVWDDVTLAEAQINGVEIL